MESVLKRLNEVMRDAIDELTTKHAAELAALHTLSQDPKDLPPALPVLDQSIRMLDELQVLVKTPLLSVIDGIFAFITSKALQTTTEIGVADILESNGSLNITSLASQTKPPSDAAQLATLLRLLCSSGIYTFNPNTQTFANSAASRLLLSSHWAQWRCWAKVYPGHFYDLFVHLPASISASEDRTALQIAMNKSAGTPVYSILGALPWFDELQEMLAAGATAQAPGMLADYPWEEIARGGRDAALCDLGGGDGTFVATLARANPTLFWAVLETEKMAQVVKDNVENDQGKYSDVADRCVAVHAGDFFKEVPPYSNYIARWTIHNWEDREAQIILRNARRAIVARQGCRFLIVESVVDSGARSGGPDGRPALFGSLVMGLGSKGAKERTENEWRVLCESAGWRVDHIYHLRHCFPMIIDLRPR